MNVAVTISSIILVIVILLLASFSLFNVNQAKAQSLTSCPIGYQRNILGTCEPVSNLQTCPIGYQRSASGLCVPVVSSQTCPVGYQQIPPGICVPVASSEFVNPYGYPTTAVNPQTTLTQPQATFNQPSSPTASLVSPTLTNPPAGQMSPWFPSLPAIACGGTSTMTTIGSIETDTNGDNNGNNNNNNNGKDNSDDDDDDDKKDYAFQIESDGGPSADPESVDGTVFAGEKNIERNNGKDFDIKDVFNDCQVSMFND
ncbi:hypothetical protein BH18THE2_BH18THE2_09900 [soil metagenome]